MLRTPTFYFMWIAYAFGCAAGLMVISQLVPFAKSVGIPSITLASFGLVVGAVGNASGRILSGWMSDHLGRINVLRLMIGISMVAMPILYQVGGNVVALFVMLFVVYWCYGTQLSVNAATAADFWGTKNVGINYGLLFTAWGVAGLLGGRIGGMLYDKYHNYQMAFYTAAVLAAIALVCRTAGAPAQACVVVNRKLDLRDNPAPLLWKGLTTEMAELPEAGIYKEWWANPAVVGLMGFGLTTMATGLHNVGFWSAGLTLASGNHASGVQRNSLRESWTCGREASLAGLPSCRMGPSGGPSLCCSTCSRRRAYRRVIRRSLGFFLIVDTCSHLAFV